MKTIIKIFITGILLIFFAVDFSSAGNLPRSREAVLIESTSPAEVMVRAKGIGYWEKESSKKKDRENFLLEEAEDDARKAAVYFILYGGADPLLTTESEKSAFAKIEEEFFQIDNIRKYIVWEGTDFLSRTKREIRKDKEYELYIEKAFKINKQDIQQYLINRGVLTAKADIIQALGMPVIMVIPAVKKGENPIQTLQTNPNLSHAAKVIESFLTARRYEVVVPEQQVDISQLAAAQQSLKNIEEDYSYQLALSIGCDVYITFEVQLEDVKYGTKKAIVNVRAYETTTARLLGTETGYSPAAPSPGQVLIEQAVNDAADKVLSRVMAYWKDDLTSGIQYKIIINISPDYNEDQAEEISFIFADLLTEIAKNKKFKENIVTDQTLDYLVWCDPEKYSRSTNLYRRMKEKFSEEFTDGTLKKVNINRKLILLRIEAE
ncbi:hypothetical protein ISS30_04350 [bacterium]|nr:hypothetical protein [bacterium]